MIIQGNVLLPHSLQDGSDSEKETRSHLDPESPPTERPKVYP